VPALKPSSDFSRPRRQRRERVSIEAEIEAEEVALVPADVSLMTLEPAACGAAWADLWW
jgi:hypothetical protein